MPTKQQRMPMEQGPNLLTLENESLKREAHKSAQDARLASEIQVIDYHCTRELSSHYQDIHRTVREAVEDTPWGELPVKPMKLHIRLDVDAMPGARANVADHLLMRYGIRLMEITFDRPGRG